AQLEEPRARIDQPLDALARRQAALLVLADDGLGPASLADGRLLAPQILDQLHQFRRLNAFGHHGSLLPKILGLSGPYYHSGFNARSIASVPPRSRPMDHVQAFLDDIREHPEDDGRRLIFAGWLDDHHHPDR